MHEPPCCITEKETCGDVSQYTTLSQNVYSLYMLFLQFTFSLCKCQACWDLCGWHLLHGDLRHLQPVVLALVKCWAVQECLVWPLSRCIVGFGAGPDTQVALGHFLGKAPVIYLHNLNIVFKGKKTNISPMPFWWLCIPVNNPSLAVVHLFKDSDIILEHKHSVCVKYCALPFTKKWSICCRH